jgi:hypothetical protein
MDFSWIGFGLGQLYATQSQNSWSQMSACMKHFKSKFELVQFDQNVKLKSREHDIELNFPRPK